MVSSVRENLNNFKENYINPAIGYFKELFLVKKILEIIQGLFKKQEMSLDPTRVKPGSQVSLNKVEILDQKLDTEKAQIKRDIKANIGVLVNVKFPERNIWLLKDCIERTPNWLDLFNEQELSELHENLANFLAKNEEYKDEDKFLLKLYNSTEDKKRK